VKIRVAKGTLLFKEFYVEDGEDRVMNEISRFTKIKRRPALY
jgi:uncharacterized protein YchJ